MTQARSVLPTDILALASYRGRSYPNEAWTRDRVGAAPAGAALEHLGVISRRNAWVSVERGRLRGLVAARRRGGHTAWEIDYLIDATQDLAALPSLLDCAVARAGRGGAEKIFLRLTAESEVLPLVRAAGFLIYQEETLFTAGPRFRSAAEAVALRLYQPGDSYLVYRLYNATTPEVVRRVEAATYGEWHAAQERRWLKDGVELVSEGNASIDAYVRAARLPQGIAIELIAAGAALENAVGVIDAAIHALGGGQAPLFLLCGRTSALCNRLDAAGFEAQRDFVSLAKRTVRPVTLPKLSPAIVKPAISV